MGLKFTKTIEWSFECDVCHQVQGGQCAHEYEQAAVGFREIEIRFANTPENPMAYRDTPIKSMAICCECLKGPFRIEETFDLSERPIAEILSLKEAK